MNVSKIVLIGSGNTATVLGGIMAEAGHRILQVVSRQPEHAERLARSWQADYAGHWDEISQDGDLYLVALADDALVSLGTELSLPGKLVVHTAGAISKTVLLPVSARSGVLYPLQSLRKGIRPFPNIPFLIDSNDPEDLKAIADFAGTLSVRVEPANDDARLKFHLAAVLVNNFTNHLYALAGDFLLRQKLDFSLLLPLITETAERVSRFPPGELQTGPAKRGDAATLGKHLTLISNDKDIKDLYSLFTSQIRHLYESQPG
jgi:predicted short-subunit dehydrogenase-like oxidoreductase (DUF2520 family)